MYINNNLIYLVDDDLEDRQFFMDALQEITNEYDVEEFTNGVALLSSLTDPEKELPNIIFLDLRMPYMTGLECLRDIKQLSNTSDILIIIYSNYHKEDELQLLRDEGADYFLIKPSTFGQLKMLLKNLLGKIKVKSTSHSKQFFIIGEA